MKRLSFSVSILAIAWLSSICSAPANTIVLHNDTQMCYIVGIEAGGKPVAPRERIEARKRYTFKFEPSAKPATLFVFADACAMGLPVQSVHVKDPRVDEVFNMIQPGHSVYIVRKP
jgi:hypothetical protein